jgi:alcohol dehydrogenase
MTRLADRSIEMILRNRVYFGVGAIERLPDVVAAAGGSRVFVVTDPGVRASGVVDRVLGVLAARNLETGVFADVEPNPGTTTVERGAAALREFGLDGTVVVPVGGGSSMDTAKALDLRAANDRPTWELVYDDPALTPGRPLVAVPTTAGTGAETNSYGVITDEAAGRKAYVGHPSLLPVATILDPALTVGLPPAATAATGIDAMTHSLESLLSANPNPFAEAIALGVIRTVGEWLSRAVDDGTDLEARSQMLMASHLAGVGQASGTGVGLVHALGHALGTRGRLAHGTALAAVLPGVLAFYLGTRDRELALVAVALGVAVPSVAAASVAEPGAAAPAGDQADGARAGVDAVARLIESVGQQRTLRQLGLGREAIPAIVEDALADPAINNSPRLPTATQATLILEAVAG